MRLKTDENLHPEVANLLQAHGHDVQTVWDEHLRGASDAVLAEACQREGRALLTLDLDFADIRAYPPQRYPGLIVLRVQAQSRVHVSEVVQRLLPILGHEPLAGRLWIVDDQGLRLRVRGED